MENCEEGMVELKKDGNVINGEIGTRRKWRRGVYRDHCEKYDTDFME